MPSGWRIQKARYATTAFSGEGARQYRGRWHSRGVPVVYLSSHQSLAALEVL
ncbi:MAG: RES family NAD+ phosphorylase, partial [Chthoniobacterales bacterium]|nr:RES family NAD+ phosphorylase [Chthoniobacterales bacterium]